MIEKYVQLKLFFDYSLPLILTGLSFGVLALLWIAEKIIQAWDKRQKRLTDKYFAEEEGEK